MDFDAFKKLALTMLLNHQQDNGNWLDDPITTIVTVEAFRDTLYHTFKALSPVESQVG
jgi:hypothetical protein